MTQYTLISTHTKSYTIGYQFSPNDPAVGTIRTKQYAMIHGPQGISQHEVWEHDGCPNGGLRFTTMEQWSNDSHCTGCDLYEYHPISD